MQTRNLLDSDIRWRVRDDYTIHGWFMMMISLFTLVVQGLEDLIVGALMNGHEHEHSSHINLLCELLILYDLIQVSRVHLGFFLDKIV